MADYRTEEFVTSMNAMLSDMQNKMLIIALRGNLRDQQLKDIHEKLQWASERVALTREKLLK